MSSPRAEPFPDEFVEALASGLPIVCADNVGFRQVIRDGVPGRFVPMRDPDAQVREKAVAGLLLLGLRK